MASELTPQGPTAFKRETRKNIEREAKGAHPRNEPDDATSRGSGPLFRSRGGRTPGDSSECDRADGGGIIARLKGGRVKKATGGSISGGGKAPSMGRAGRKRGGGVGADLHPMTHSGGSGPKGRKINKADRLP